MVLIYKMTHELYCIPGATNILNHNMQDPSVYPEFQEDLEKFKELVCGLVYEEKSATFIHFGDGDGYFLNGIPVGSATPGKRALSKQYSEINLSGFREGFLKNTYICIEKFERNIEAYKSLYPNGPIHWATEFLYGLTANKWFFKTFKGRIGLIGAKEKLDTIKSLLQYQEYRDYLGLEQFEDYINIPQKFACDDLDLTCEMVRKQLVNSKSDIFLFGVGHVKSGLVYHFPEWKKGVYIDVGSGIDAIAGVIDPERPYMGGWVNYHLPSGYNNLDLLQYNHNGKIVQL